MIGLTRLRHRKGPLGPVAIHLHNYQTKRRRRHCVLDCRGPKMGPRNDGGQADSEERRKAQHQKNLRLFAFFDLAFFEDNMLTNAWVVLLQLELCRVFWVLLCDIKNARASRADELDVILCLCHFTNPASDTYFSAL